MIMRRSWVAFVGAALVAATLSGCAKPGPGAVGWKTFRDPSPNHAFLLDVPSGWGVAGGSFPLDTGQLRSGVLTFSPDKSMYIFVGDMGIPDYMVPVAVPVVPGYTPPALPTINGATAAAYQTGDQFASTWGAMRLHSSGYCDNPVPLGAQPLATNYQSVPSAFGTPMIQNTFSAGQATFSCAGKDGPRVGYAFAITRLATLPGGLQPWDVKYFAVYLAKPKQAERANAILAHMLATEHMDPDFAARKAGLDAARIGQLTASNGEVAETIKSTFAFQQAAFDKAMETYDKTLRDGT
jgi:hypothetical protein